MLVLPRLKGDTNNGLLSYHTDIGICYCQTQNLIVASTIYEPNGRGVVTGEWVDKIIDSVTTTTSLNARAPISTSLPPIPLNSILPFCFVSLKFNPNLPSIQNPWISLQGTWLLSSKGLKVLMSYNVFKPILKGSPCKHFGGKNNSMMTWLLNQFTSLTFIF